jgi:hypothetical protein
MGADAFVSVRVELSFLPFFNCFAAFFVAMVILLVNTLRCAETGPVLSNCPGIARDSNLGARIRRKVIGKRRESFGGAEILALL